MDRRDFLTIAAGAVATVGAGTAGAASLLPAVVEEPLPRVIYPQIFINVFDDVIAQNVRAMQMHCESCAQAEIDNVQQLNRILLAKNPDVFAFNFRTQTPNFLYETSEGVTAAVNSKSRVLEHSYKIETLKDDMIEAATDNRTVHEEIAEKVGEELRKVQKSLRYEQIVWYVPIWPTRALDLNTWHPQMMFKTRYATIPLDARIA